MPREDIGWNRRCSRKLRYAAVRAACSCQPATRACSRSSDVEPHPRRALAARIQRAADPKSTCPTRCGLLAAGGEARPVLSCAPSPQVRAAHPRRPQGTIAAATGCSTSAADRKARGGEGVTRLLVHCASGRCHHGSTSEFDWIAHDASVRNLCPRVRIRVGRQF